MAYDMENDVYDYMYTNYTDMETINALMDQYLKENIPYIVNFNEFLNKMEIYNWIIENIEGCFFIEGRKVYFSEFSDATLFKLSWGYVLDLNLKPVS